LFFGASHGVDFGRIINSAVYIIYSKRKCELRILSAQHRPVCFQVREIIHVQSCHGIHAHVFDNVRLGHMTHGIVFIAEFEWDECVKAASFILQLPQLFHMINAVTEFFDMSVQNGCIAMHTQFMRGFMNSEPAFCIYLISTNLFTNFRIKNFCAAAGQGIETCFLQIFQSFFDRLFRLSKHIFEFHRCESFYMQVGAVCFYFS